MEKDRGLSTCQHQTDIQPLTNTRDDGDFLGLSITDVTKAGSNGHATPYFHESSRYPNSDLKRDSDAFKEEHLPRLRKKPKLILSHSSHIRKASATISRSPSVPTFHPDSEEELRLSTSSGSVSRNPLLRSNTSPLLRRSSTHKKPPASHSSLGVETIIGPPPSYSTQRTHSQDRVWKADRPAGSQISTNQNHQTVSHEPTRELLAAHSTEDKSISHNISSPETLDSTSITTPRDQSTSPTHVDSPQVHHDLHPTMPGLGMMDEETKGSSSDERKSEDLFLHISRADAARASEAAYKNDRRRSRISLPFFSNTRQSGEQRSSPLPSTFDHSEAMPQSAPQQYYNKRSALGQHMPGALSRTNSQEPDSNAPRPFSRSTYFDRGARMVSESQVLEKTPLGDTTESTVSTTAPSTVWDELDDLKSRIRNLELTGKLPSSSAAAMATNDRPRTATTAATTISSSPKHKTTNTTLQSAIEGIPSNMHPLLHEALGHARGVLPNDVFQKLQTTASDALQLTAMMSGDPGNTSSMGGASTERQLRRRAESMCRSLTELAIALSAEPKTVNSPAHRPCSRDVQGSANAGLRNRGYSNDNGDRPPVSVRVQSRLESRRVSLQTGPYLGHISPSTSTATHTPLEALPQLPGSHPSSRINRTSTQSRNRRTPDYFDGAIDDDDSSPVVRPVSRAMTELNSRRLASRDRSFVSRDYTSQYSMPTSVHPVAESRTSVSANVSSNLLSHRKYASPASVIGAQDSSPLTPKEPWGRISIVPTETISPDVTPESNNPLRERGSRRSLGFASRLGSSVGSRLRAVKAERTNSARDMETLRGNKGMAPSMQDTGNVPQEFGPKSSSYEE